MINSMRESFARLHATGVVRHHLRGIVAGTVLGTLATMPMILRTIDHSPRIFAVFVAGGAWLIAFVIATPLLIGVLLMWTAVLKRWPSIQHRAFAHWALLSGLALLVALTTHTILTLSAAAAEPDGFSIAYARWRFVSDREILLLQAIAATAWLVIPQRFRNVTTLTSTNSAI